MNGTPPSAAAARRRTMPKFTITGDRDKAHAAAAELVRHLDDRRTHPPSVNNLLLPAATELLEQCGGDPIRALYILADVVNDERLTDPTQEGAQ